MLRKWMRHLSISITRSIELSFVSPYRERLKMLDWIFSEMEWLYDEWNDEMLHLSFASVLWKHIIIFLAAESNSGKKCAALALSSNRLVRIRDVRNNGRLLYGTRALMIGICISIIHWVDEIQMKSEMKRLDRRGSRWSVTVQRMPWWEVWRIRDEIIRLMEVEIMSARNNGNENVWWSVYCTPWKSSWIGLMSPCERRIVQVSHWTLVGRRVI